MIENIVTNEGIAHSECFQTSFPAEASNVVTMRERVKGIVKTSVLC